MRLRALLFLLLCVALFQPSPSVIATPQPAAASTTLGVFGGSFNAVAVVSSAPGAALIAVGEGAALSLFALQSDNSLARLSRLELPGLVRTVQVVDGVAYVASDLAGLQIVDVADPAKPKLLSALPLEGPALDLRVVSGVAYLAAQSGGLQIVDIQAPSRPRLLASLPLTGTAVSVDASDGYAYVNDGVLRVVDVRNPVKPVLRASLDSVLGISVPYRLNALRVSGTRLYALTSYNRFPLSSGVLDVIDIRNPEKPVLLDGFMGLQFALDLELRGDTAYVADGFGLRTIDLRSSSKNPVWNTIDLSGKAQGVALVGERAIVAAGDYLHVVQAIPSPLSLASSFSGEGSPYAAQAAGQLAYTAEQVQTPLQVQSRLRVVNIANQGNSNARRELTLPFKASIAVSGTHVYATSGDRFQLIDAAPTQPVLQSELALAGFPTVVVAANRLAYVGLGNGGLQIVDPSNPSSLVARGRITTLGGTTALQVVSDTVYMASSDLSIVDVSDPDKPILRGSLAITAPVTGLQVDGTTLYLSYTTFTGTETVLLTIDAADPAQPRIVGRLQLPVNAELRARVGSALYVAYGEVLFAINAANPQRLVVRGAVAVPGGARAVSPVGAALLIAAGDGGLRVLRLDSNAFTNVYLPLVAR